MEQSNQSKKVLLSVIGVAILVVAVVGVSFAFFSYTRTGSANTVQTGTIVFSNTSSEVELTNAFPVATSVANDATDAITNQVGYGSISVQGNTTYANGIDFEIRVTSVSSQSNGAIVPRVAVTTTDVASKIDMTTDYTSTAASTLTNGTLLAHGTIAANANVTSDTKVFEVKVWYDANDYHISDNTKSELVAAGLLDTNYSGTIVSTTDWNAMTSNAYSFTIRVNAVEGGATMGVRSYS